MLFTELDGYGKAIGLEPKSIRPRIPHEIVFAFGGWVNSTPTTLIETYDVRTNKWFKSYTNRDYPRAYQGTQVFK